MSIRCGDDTFSEMRRCDGKMVPTMVLATAPGKREEAKGPPMNGTLSEYHIEYMGGASAGETRQAIML
jgi:hypothetical protein